jgi:hypothetical protein
MLFGFLSSYRAQEKYTIDCKELFIKMLRYRIISCSFLFTQGYFAVNLDCCATFTCVLNTDVFAQTC